MKLDILTIAFLTSLLMLTQTLAVLVQFRLNKAYKRIGWWLAGSTAQAVGFIIMSLFYVRGISFISMFANPLVFAGQTFLYMGITKLMNIKETKWFVIISNILFNILYFYCIVGNNSITGRTVVVLAGAAIISFITAYKMFFKYDKKIIGSIRFTAAIFFIYGCFSLARFFYTIAFEPIKTYELLFQNTLHIAGFIVPSIAATLWTFGFIIIVNQMLISDNREAREEAERASQAKERFLTSMSHEIRTPLNGIMGMIQIMKFTDMDQAQKKYTTTIEKESKILLNLLNNILDYSKLKHGKDVLNIEKTDIREMIKELKTFFSVNINPQVDILFHTEETVPKIIMCDKIKLQGVLINLIGNAIKFTEKGSIVLRVSSKEKSNNNSFIMFSVEDTGIGMSQNVIDKLFVEFSQADGQNIRKYGGTGLGLSISKELVELMGGEIKVSSIEKIGTSFTFDIPCRYSEENIPRIFDVETFFINENKHFNKEFTKVLENVGIKNIKSQKSIEEFRKNVGKLKKDGSKFIVFMNENSINDEDDQKKMEMTKEFQANVVYLKRIENKNDTRLIRTIEYPIEQEELCSLIKAVEEGQMSGKQVNESTNEMPIFKEELSIMVIEDNGTSREVLKELFQRVNCKADLFESGTTAIKKMKEKDYDVVITDIELPDINGFDILKKIRIIDKEKGKYTPVIATTAHILDGFREQCLSAGMDEYMPKPIDLNELCVIINKHTIKNKKIEKIIGIDREQEIIRKVEPIAFRDAKISLKKMEDFLEEEKYEEIKKESHKLKGSFSSIRRKDIEDRALEIFRFSDEKSKEKIIESIKKIDKEITLYEDSCNRG